MKRFILDTHECVYYVDKLKLRGNYIPRRTATLSLNDDGRTAHGRLMLVGGEHVCDVDGNMGSRDSSSQTKNQIRRSIITFEERSRTRERNRQCASVHGCLGGGNPSDINLWCKWVIEDCRCRLSSGCSSKGLWCLGIPSGNQQEPSRREVRRELSRRE